MGSITFLSLRRRRFKPQVAILILVKPIVPSLSLSWLQELKGQVRAVFCQLRSSEFDSEEMALSFWEFRSQDGSSQAADLSQTAWLHGMALERR